MFDTFLNKNVMLKCLFVCLFGFIVPLEHFAVIWRRHHYQWRAANFDLCSALMAIEQWWFFSVWHLLWQGAYVYNGHLRGPVTLTPIVECLAVELSLPVLLLRSGIRTSLPPIAVWSSNHCAAASTRLKCEWLKGCSRINTHLDFLNRLTKKIIKIFSRGKYE